MGYMRRIALPLIALFAVGCGGSKPTMVGTWTIPVDTVSNLEANLKEDGTLALDGTYQSVKLSASGTWTLKEDALTVKPEKLNIPEELKAVAALFKNETDKMMVPTTMTIEWVNDNEVRVTPPAGVSQLFNKPFVMRRKPAQ